MSLIHHVATSIATVALRKSDPLAFIDEELSFENHKVKLASLVLARRTVVECLDLEEVPPLPEFGSRERTAICAQKRAIQVEVERPAPKLYPQTAPFRSEYPDIREHGPRSILSTPAERGSDGGLTYCANPFVGEKNRSKSELGVYTGPRWSPHPKWRNRAKKRFGIL